MLKIFFKIPFPKLQGFLGLSEVTTPFISFSVRLLSFYLLTLHLALLNVLVLLFSSMCISYFPSTVLFYLL